MKLTQNQNAFLAGISTLLVGFVGTYAAGIQPFINGAVNINGLAIYLLSTVLPAIGVAILTYLKTHPQQVEQAALDTLTQMHLVPLRNDVQQALALLQNIQNVQQFQPTTPVQTPSQTVVNVHPNTPVQMQQGPLAPATTTNTSGGTSSPAPAQPMFSRVNMIPVEHPPMGTAIQSSSFVQGGLAQGVATSQDTIPRAAIRS